MHVDELSERRSQISEAISLQDMIDRVGWKWRVKQA